MVFLSRFTIGSKSKAIAADAPKFGLLIAGLFCCGDELTPCVHATVRLAISGVLMVFGDRYAGAGRFADVQWRAVTTEGFYRRPLRQYWNRRWCYGCEFLCGMDNLPCNDGEDRFNAFDLFRRRGNVVIRERDQIGQLARGDRPFLPALARKPAAALGVES